MQFASQFLKDQAVALGHASIDSPVLYWGVDLAQFPWHQPIIEDRRRLLFVGQVVRHKGVHTAVAAVDELRRRYGWENLELEIVGGSAQGAYLGEISRLIASLGCEDRVRLRGMVPRCQLAEIYHNHEILLFPSTWDEPFGITLLEAMASGTAVVATATGGSREIVDDGQNALVFPVGDAAACARHVDSLLRNPSFASRLRTAARRTVECRFQLDHSVNRISADLARIATQRPTH